MLRLKSLGGLLAEAAVDWASNLGGLLAEAAVDWASNLGGLLAEALEDWALMKLRVRLVTKLNCRHWGLGLN